MELLDDLSEEDVDEYFKGVARARYAVRKSFRIVDEQARKAGLEPLQHQALIQVLGAERGDIHVNEIAERLDIAPAFASRIVRDLARKGLVRRQTSDKDRRITLVLVTDEGRKILRQINHEVQFDVQHFQRRLTADEKAAALTIFAFYVGVALDRAHAEALAQVSPG